MEGKHLSHLLKLGIAKYYLISIINIVIYIKIGGGGL